MSDVTHEKCSPNVHILYIQDSLKKFMKVSGFIDVCCYHLKNITPLHTLWNSNPNKLMTISGVYFSKFCLILFTCQHLGQATLGWPTAHLPQEGFETCYIASCIPIDFLDYHIPTELESCQFKSVTQGDLNVWNWPITHRWNVNSQFAKLRGHQPSLTLNIPNLMDTKLFGDEVFAVSIPSSDKNQIQGVSNPYAYMFTLQWVIAEEGLRNPLHCIT